MKTAFLITLLLALTGCAARAVQPTPESVAAVAAAQAPQRSGMAWKGFVWDDDLKKLAVDGRGAAPDKDHADISVGPQGIGANLKVEESSPVLSAWMMNANSGPSTAGFVATPFSLSNDYIYTTSADGPVQVLGIDMLSGIGDPALSRIAFSGITTVVCDAANVEFNDYLKVSPTSRGRCTSAGPTCEPDECCFGMARSRKVTGAEGKVLVFLMITPCVREAP